MSDQILDEIDEALHDEKKLNLTADEKDILEDLPEGLNDLMKQLNVEDQEEDINSDQFKEMMGNMLKGLQGGADGDNMNDMFERMNTGGFDQMADKLLMQFMEKDILYQPLLETKANYDQYLETNKTLSPEDYQKYSKQRDCVNALLTQLEKDPSQLLLKYKKGIIKLQSIKGNNLMTHKFKYTDRQVLDLTITETELKLQDATGVQQLTRQGSNKYLKHLYSVETINKNDSIDLITSEQMIQQIEIGRSLYMLTKAGIRSIDKFIHREQQNLQLPYQTIEFCLHNNPYCLFLLSMAEIKLYDTRANFPETLHSLELGDLAEQRFMSMVNKDQYLITANSRNITYFDVRNMRNPVTEIRHGSEQGLQQFVKPMHPMAFDEIPNGLVKSKDLFAYSTLENGQAVVFNASNNQTKLQSLIQQDMQQSIQMIPTMPCRYLKLRGLQALQLDDQLIFTLDNRSGICMSIFNDSLPIKIHQQKHFKNYELYCKQNSPIRIEKQYAIFDFSSDSDLELEPPQSKKKFINPPDIELLPVEIHNEERVTNFEDMILMGDLPDTSDNKISANQQFILTQQMIDEL